MITLAIFLVAIAAFIIGLYVGTRLIALRPRGFIFISTPDGRIFTMSLNITEGQSGNAVVVFTDANGVSHPLAPGNIPVWACDPPSALTLSPAPDGMSCGITAGTTDGPVTLTCTGEGDPEAGKDTIVASFSLTVVAPEDTQGTISVTLN